MRFLNETHNPALRSWVACPSPHDRLPSNYKWVSIGYHGRAPSIGVSGQSFSRPVGQTMPAGATEPASDTANFN